MTWTSGSPLSRDFANIALAVVDHIPAMVAYWDAEQRCRFANAAYRDWFGRTREQMLGITMTELLGPIYLLNLPYIEGALRGEPQTFEREIPDPRTGLLRHSIANYIPDARDGVVHGFYVHVADTTPLVERERVLARVIQERDRALAEVRTLRGMLPVCSVCKSIRDEKGEWVRVEEYIAKRTEAEFTHSLCPACAERLYPGLSDG
ncbi:MAG TPA: PAS domain-containing protein [Gemmatimonadales bacterium]|jgi:PAS domain S-box-containing protein|nr:PAS domain-containing protein [Gemmatimonadales bacterium]